MIDFWRSKKYNIEEESVHIKENRMKEVDIFIGIVLLENGR